ncbi:uncharacterized protein LOC122041243 isoform X3 [Zingiber officinale]|uniref:uncharacterized protein LOC122041243 isoform X3 n=1 Tax=Zingiber officinale TaxID=94328 RepID=UPI001C4D826E|nr:uncharacterized protein LOC122041243 isoform X3 [Zingiber officinale]
MAKKSSPNLLLPVFASLIRFRPFAALSVCVPRRRPYRSSLRMDRDFALGRSTLVAKLRSVRWIALLLGLSNLSVILLGVFLLIYLLRNCSGDEKLPFAASILSASIRVLAMVGAGKAQHETAEIIVSFPIESAAADAAVRHERRLRYKKWLWWTRFGIAVTVLQSIGAAYLTFIALTDLSHGGSCLLGQHTVNQTWKKILVVSFLLLAWLVVIIQLFMGADILRWRSFYSTHDTAWKAHYSEVFDHGIREALCCLGRAKYLSVLEEDEIYSVARLLGDLVAYRASGTGHLELLAGLALLQSQKQVQNLHNKLMDVPDQLIEDAAFFHQFAEAAYTGPLLDFGRNPILFPCAWLYRQGIVTPWARNRPSLEGDNWWRGHAAAFLKFVNLPPEALCMGRVSQTKREAAYFVVVLHDKRTIVVAVRGTETPEDLITDGLCRECDLTMEDLDGLINSEHLPSDVRQKVLSSFPHYGHAGIIESARELFIQLDGQSEVKDSLPSKKTGFLSSLLAPGSECQGYQICVVGHSLGGAIATFLGLRLYGRHPKVHVYAYGGLPCLDFVTAEACSKFVTTIVYNDEFSAQLSVNSILRLRASAISALSDDSLAESAMIQKLARRILHANKYDVNEQSYDLCASPLRQNCVATFERNHISKRWQSKTSTTAIEPMNQELCLDETASGDDASELAILVDQDDVRLNSYEIVKDQMAQCFEERTSSVQASTAPPEMYLPGCVVHITYEPKRVLPFWRSWTVHERDHTFRAFVANRESFRDIRVTSRMFIDHLPWRCHYAMQRILKEQKLKGKIHAII